MTRWPIERSWLVIAPKDERSTVRTSELRQFSTCALLGAAGLGKTFEVSYLSALDRQAGADVHTERLVVLGQTAEGLTNSLKALAEHATPNTILNLDALDEVMIPVQQAGLIVGKWIREQLSANRPALRISCRSAVWPSGIQAALSEVYGEAGGAVAILQPLSDNDIRVIASSHGVDAEGFVAAVERARTSTLAQQPLTLQMLLKVYKAHRELPAKRCDLFAAGMQELASERAERFEDGTAIDIPVSDLLEAAERLACYCLLSGRVTVDLGDAPSSSSLGRNELGGLPTNNRVLDDSMLRAIGRSGLCEGDGERRFRFAHRQFAEYLAGRRLARLLPHQARAVLGVSSSGQAGVAGPLRETASFAAMKSDAIAEWLTRDDPEVVGLSDITDAAMRRRAMLNLLEKFRSHELTDSQIGRDGIEMAGFQYDGAELDLSPVLRERQQGCEDVLECAVELIESWQFVSMSDDLAELMLDAQAPLHPRKAAGYALSKFGTLESRKRLLPLITGRPDDPDFDLKGLALRCNWPESLSTLELLDALTPAPVGSYHGAYDGFLFQLDQQEFEAAGHRVEGLEWAAKVITEGRDYHPLVRIAKRIAIASLSELDQPGVCDALAHLILVATDANAGSPLAPPRSYSSETPETTEEPPRLALQPETRRALLTALTKKASGDRDVWWAVRETPGMFMLDDFPWLLEQATSPSNSMAERKHFAMVAQMLPWLDDAGCVDAWLKVREVEPVQSLLSSPLLIELGSDAAKEARKAHAEMKRWSRHRQHRRKRVRPSPADRVERALSLCETKSPRFFLNLTQELTLEEFSEHYGFQRFLTQSPGWIAASENTRSRIVEAAKRLLTARTGEPARAKSSALNTILPGYMPAMWLAMEIDRAWFDSLQIAWWKRWAWYIIRELHPHMMGEPDEPKAELLRELHQRVPGEVRRIIVKLAKSDDEESRGLLKTLFDMFDQIEDSRLDARLCQAIRLGTIPMDRLQDVTQFVLSRDVERAVSSCISILNPATAASGDDAIIKVAVALLQERTREAWPRIFELLNRRPDLTGQVLGGFAYGNRRRARHSDSDHPEGLAALSAGQIGQLVSLLLMSFPPENDPQDSGGAKPVRPSDAARWNRDRLITWLGDCRDLEAVETLRMLERQFGHKYAWLRRPRARAERGYRLSQWEPVPPAAVAKMIMANDKHLLRSPSDALDGVVAAVTDYATNLRQGHPNNLEDLWNRPSKGTPTPKDEERVSDKICLAIRDYFRQHAVSANREVQVFRRKLAADLGGAAGSEVDVLCQVPAVGSLPSGAIEVPVEVKLAHNREARTGMRDQLLMRYMRELGTQVGVYVVAWMGTGLAAANFRPLWKSPEAAREELEEQARTLNVNSSEPIDIRVVVIDASLPLESKPPRRKKERKAASSTGKQRRRPTVRRGGS